MRAQDTLEGLQVAYHICKQKTAREALAEVSAQIYDIEDALS